MKRSGHLDRSLRALGWSVAGQGGVQATRFAFGVVLARLLSPREFGLLAMVSVLTQFAIVMVDFGLGDALVQRRDLRETHRSSVFWAVVVAGCLLSVVTAAAAPWVAAFYGVEELSALTRMLAPLLVLRAVGTVPRALLVRELDFRRTVQIEGAAVVIAGALAVVLAWRGFGVTSLAVQLLAGTALESLFLLLACGWRPRAALRIGAVRDVLAFATSRVATRLVGYWGRRLDTLLVGKLLGAGPLGLYSRADGAVQFAVLYVARATARVMFPSLSLIQDEPARVRRAYLRATGGVALATVPVCLGLFVTAEPFVVGLLGGHWREAVPLVRILALGGLVRSITTLASSLYLSQGHPALHLRLSAVQMLVVLPAVLVGARWGVNGVAAAYAVAVALVAVPTLALAGRLVDLRVSEVLAHIAPVALVGVVMAAVVAGLDVAIGARFPPLVVLALEVMVGGLVYAAGVVGFRIASYRDVMDVLRGSAQARA